MAKLIQLKFTASLYTDGPKPKLIKKNLTTFKTVEISDIKYPEQIYNSKGNIVRGKCKIVLKDLGPTIISHSYEYIDKLIREEEPKIPVGFKYKGRIV